MPVLERLRLRTPSVPAVSAERLADGWASPYFMRSQSPEVTSADGTDPRELGRFTGPIRSDQDGSDHDGDRASHGRGTGPNRRG